MSSRSIVKDVSEARRLELMAENIDSEWETVWEAFTNLRLQGYDLGDKANARVAKRIEIKKRIPKG
jgi:hypothetical protein